MLVAACIPAFSPPSPGRTGRQGHAFPQCVERESRGGARGRLSSGTKQEAGSHSPFHEPRRANWEISPPERTIAMTWQPVQTGLGTPHGAVGAAVSGAGCGNHHTKKREACHVASGNPAIPIRTPSDQKRGGGGEETITSSHGSGRVRPTEPAWHVDASPAGTARHHLSCLLRRVSQQRRPDDRRFN